MNEEKFLRKFDWKAMKVARVYGVGGAEDREYLWTYFQKLKASIRKPHSRTTACRAISTEKQTAVAGTVRGNSGAGGSQVPGQAASQGNSDVISFRAELHAPILYAVSPLEL